MTRALHIVCFDIPFPPSYGGAIDVYYRIQALAQAGVKITLHCTYKGTLTHYAELESLCHKVYYYPRNLSIKAFFSLLPYTVSGRRNADLLQNLLEDDAPILFEGLVDCYYINHPLLKHRKRFFRECNVEHDYYHALGKATYKLWEKIYFHLEAYRLQRFERVLSSIDGILALAHQDEQHFRLTYPEVPVYYLPCFHENKQVISRLGNGEYILYHGNLAVAENDRAALYIVEEIAPLLMDQTIVIAGKGASGKLKQKCLESANIQLVDNPDVAQIHDLLTTAHVHLMITFQGTGIKLKLINALYQGRFVVANESMVIGTDLASACHMGNTPHEIAQQCRTLMACAFSETEIEKRKKILAPWDISSLSQQLESVLFA